MKTHFGGEEALMRTHRYGDSAEHLAQHRFFVEEFEALVKEYERTGGSGALGIRLNRLLCEWLRTHVATIDRKLGDFIVAKGARTPAPAGASRSSSSSERTRPAERRSPPGSDST